LFDEYVDKLGSWLSQLDYVALGWELVVLILALGGAVTVHRTLGKFLLKTSSELEDQQIRRITLRSIQRIVFPLSMLFGALVGRAILVHQQLADPLLLHLAVPLMLSLAVIRLVVYALRQAFRPGPAVKAWENLISTSIWLLVALHMLGWLPRVAATLDAFGYTFGDVRISVFTVLQLLIVIGALMVLAAWLSNAMEHALARATYLSSGVRIGATKTVKLLLYTLAFLLSLSAVGINLGALAIFGGALGVGLGFGLQRIASNFISGFILVFDRSIRPGDVISINEKFGWVQELRARYIVVRDRDGVETLIPNENLITSEVINWSYSDPQVRLKLPVQISYDDDPEQAMAIMARAAENCARVLETPPAAPRLVDFGDNGIDLELRIWIRDPQKGVGNVRSDVNLAIWRGFREAGITIPYPQRDLYLKQTPEHTPL
jgi:small-conductance mechanosensitive channel